MVARRAAYQMIKKLSAPNNSRRIAVTLRAVKRSHVVCMPWSPEQVGTRQSGIGGAEGVLREGAGAGYDDIPEEQADEEQ